MAKRYRSNPYYTEGQVKNVLKSIGVGVHSETRKNLICYCPLHSNRHSPSFAVAKKTGLYYCFNSACKGNKGGSLEWLVKQVTDSNDAEAHRLIESNGLDNLSLSEVFDEIWEVNPEYRPVAEQFISGLESDMTEEARNYLRGRGFSDETIDYFRCGYNAEKRRVVVPIFHHDNNDCVGWNERSIDHKFFKVSEEFPRNSFLFNLNNAKRYPTVVICESQFDTMKIHEAGFPNAVCPLGSYMSDDQLNLIRRYFTRVIIMTDRDDAGRTLGFQISDGLMDLEVEWAVWDYGLIYPRDCKDAGDMNDMEIRHCIKNSVSDWEYRNPI